MTYRIALAGDHAGFLAKNDLKTFLEQEGHTVNDFGPFSTDSVDYPDAVHPACEAIEKGEFDFGIFICGSGQGVAMTANKHQGIRAALCWQEKLAMLARSHNNANALCLPARFVAIEELVAITSTFLATEFEGGRHQGRVQKISC